MSVDIGVGGAWKDVNAISVGVGGAWKAVQKGWIGVGGVWKVFYEYLAATLTDRTINDFATSPANAAAGIKIDSDGGVYRLNGSTYTFVETWLTGGGTAADYESRWTSTSGTLSSGVEATWQSCSVDTGYNRNNNLDALSTETCTGTLEIRSASSGTVLATATITLNANVDV